ncbi:hypothetical protein GW17_00056862 [Ensete ventricosum]|nr:hypothetical protein GW17_00056862 [Ensete ventricosum]
MWKRVCPTVVDAAGFPYRLYNFAGTETRWRQRSVAMNGGRSVEIGTVGLVLEEGLEEEEHDDGGVRKRKARIFRGEGRSRLAMSYSSTRLARSSSEVTETRASRSSVGSWHRRLTAPHPHNSLSFTCSSGLTETKEMKKKLTDLKEPKRGEGGDAAPEAAGFKPHLGTLHP